MEKDEKEEEAKLLEMLKDRSRQSSESEILELVKTSLRRKANALEEDSWIYDPGSDQTLR